MSIVRPPYDAQGLRVAACDRCGIAWLEGDPITRFGQMCAKGPRPHECPEPLPYEQARYLVEVAQATPGGIVVSQRFRASVKLGLELGPPA